MRALKFALVRQPARKACAASPKPRKAIEPELINESGMGSLGGLARRERGAHSIVSDLSARQRAEFSSCIRLTRPTLAAGSSPASIRRDRALPARANGGNGSQMNCVFRAAL